MSTFGGNGVDLVNEDDGRSILAGKAKGVPDHARAFTEVLLDELGSDHTNEGCLCVVSHCLDQHGLSRPRGSIKKHTTAWDQERDEILPCASWVLSFFLSGLPRRVDSNLFVQIKVGQGQLDCLPDLLLLNVKTSHVGEANIGPLVLRKQRNTG